MRAAELYQALFGYGAPLFAMHYGKAALVHNLQVVADGALCEVYAEVLELIDGQVILLIEIKGGSESFPGIEKRTVEAIKDFNAGGWTIVQSFNEKAIERVKTLDPDIITYYLLGSNFTEYYREFRNRSGKSPSPAFGYDGIGVHYKMLTTGAIDSIQHAGLEVFTWTVNDVSDMTGMINAGVDEIITDSPDKLIGLIR